MNSNLPANTPAANATTVQIPRSIAIGGRFCCCVWQSESLHSKKTQCPMLTFGLITDVREESIDRFTRFRSARISAAVWQRMSRSFSSALLMVSSSFTGSSGISRVGAVGVRLRIASRDDRRSLSPKRQHSGRHFVKHHSKREKIGASVQFLAAQLLRRHVGDGAHRRSRTREVKVRERRRWFASQPTGGCRPA